MIVISSLVAAPLLLITAFFTIEVAAGLGRGKQSVAAIEGAARAVIVVPAHDEAATVEPLLSELHRQAEGVATILLIADNCSDDTAAIARRVGVRTVERHNAEHRGKGFALAFARDELLAAPPEVVVVLDADCAIDRASLATLVGCCAASDRPCQAVNLLRGSSDSSPMVQISNFAFMLKNLVRQRGLQRLAGSVHLTGTGMAMPWHLFAAAELATASIVEDVKLGLELTEAGSPPMLVHGANVWSEASSAGGTLVQRQRWEGGNMQLAANIVPPLLASAVRRASPRLLVRAFDFLVPPLTMLVLLDAVLTVTVATVVALTGRGGGLLTIILLVDLAAIVAIGVAWLLEGRAFLRPRTLLAIPAYVLWKLPLYARLRRHGAKEWLRAGR